VIESGPKPTAPLVLRKGVKGFLLSPMVRSGQEGGSVPPESEDLIRIGLGSRTLWPKSNDNR